MKIKFWGTRGSIPVPGKDTTKYGGNTTCVEITLQSGKTVIIDAGTGLRSLGSKLLSENNYSIIYLLISHIHWDHVLGFPFFDPIYDPSKQIFIDGHKNSLKGLKNTFDNKMGDGFFPVKFDDLKAKIKHLRKLNNGSLIIDDTVIDSIQTYHPQGALGFRFREEDKTLVFITDNELLYDSSEERSSKRFEEFCYGADVLIHDSQYTPDEIDERRGWGHSDYQSVFELAYNSGVKKVILFHHNPSTTDAELAHINKLCYKLAKKRKSKIVIEMAREGHEFEL